MQFRIFIYIFVYICICVYILHIIYIIVYAQIFIHLHNFCVSACPFLPWPHCDVTIEIASQWLYYGLLRQIKVSLFYTDEG